jgi:hypothetical protein
MNTRLVLASIAMLSASSALASSSAVIALPCGDVKASIALSAKTAAPGDEIEAKMMIDSACKADALLYAAPLNLRYVSGGEQRQIIADGSVRMVRVGAGSAAHLLWKVTLPADADRGSDVRIGTMLRDSAGRGALLWAIVRVDDGLVPEIPERRMRHDQKPLPKPTFEGDIHTESKPDKGSIEKH